MALVENLDGLGSSFSYVFIMFLYFICNHQTLSLGRFVFSYRGPP